MVRVPLPAFPTLHKAEYSPDGSRQPHIFHHNFLALKRHCGRISPRLGRDIPRLLLEPYPRRPLQTRARRVWLVGEFIHSVLPVK